MNARLDRLRSVNDLYVKGATVVLADGSPLWVRVLNPFEQDTARSEAQIARARLALAIREVGTDEQAKVRESFFETGKEAATELLVESKVAERYSKIVEGLRYDPEWKERLDVLARASEDTAKPLEGIEREAMEKIAADYFTELNSRIDDERAGHRAVYENADEDTLWNDYLDLYVDRRAGAAALAEHQMYQILYGTYLCDGRLDGGEWDHSRCTHDERLFESPAEVKDLPSDLWEALLAGIGSIDMSVIEGKSSGSRASSSDSSPLPSAPEESTPSTQDATQAEPTGS